jgi:hypothetical protein
MALPGCGEVLVVNPLFGFVRMSSLGPLPHGLMNVMVYVFESSFAGGVPMIVDPAPDNRVKHSYQLSG